MELELIRQPLSIPVSRALENWNDRAPCLGFVSWNWKKVIDKIRVIFRHKLFQSAKIQPNSHRTQR